MSYTVVAKIENSPVSTVLATAVDAVKLIRSYRNEGAEEIIVCTDGGWFLTPTQLEDLVAGLNTRRQ